MVAMKTEFLNVSGVKITLKEVNVGVTIRTVGTLDGNNGSLTVGVQKNSTFTQFNGVQDADPPVPDIVFTSDEIAEYKEITIYQKLDKTFSWKGVQRAQHPSAPKSIFGSIRLWTLRRLGLDHSDQQKEEQEGN